MTACIVGWAHSRFGKLEGQDLEALIATVASEAIADAGLGPGDIDEIFIGNFNGGFSRQEFPSSLVLQIDPQLRFTPATRVENACATGSAAIHQGLNAIAAKRARRVLVVGVEKMTEVTGPAVGEILIKAAYLKEEGAIEGGFAGVFGRITQMYFQRYGDKSDALARIAARTTRTALPTLSRKSAKTWATNSAALSRTKIPSSPVPCGAPIARWCPTAPPRWC